MNDENDQQQDAGDDATESKLYPMHVRQGDGRDKLVDIQGRLADQSGSWKAFLGDDDRVLLYNESTHVLEEHDLSEAQRLPRFPKLRTAALDREDERNRGEGPNANRG